MTTDPTPPRNQQPVQYESEVHDLPPEDAVSDYAEYLIAKYGRPMERALIRARHRYAKAHPDRARLTRMHAAYARRR